MSEEEEMELSGESNLVSNLHNFSFDVSWSTSARDMSPPLQRHHGQLISPARFQSASTPNQRKWKSLTLKEKPTTFPSVKVSQKSSTMYSPVRTVKSPEDTRSLSPMDCDLSQSSADFSKSCSQLRKRHSDFGVSYDKIKPKDVPKMNDISETSLISPISKRNGLWNESTLEDSVFEKDTPKLNKRKSRNQKNSSDNNRSTQKADTQDTFSKSSIIVLVMVVLFSSFLGMYVYFQMERCAVFDVDTVKLQHKLEDNVFGQHIAVKSVIEALEGFKNSIRGKKGKRSLVMSFHGWTGIGKNFVSRFIAEAFYNAKVSLFVGPLHLVKKYTAESEEDSESVKPNKTAEVKDWIMNNVTNCGVNVIIIDEIDKADKDSLVGIQSAIESLNKKSRVKSGSGVKVGPISVFLFLSNSRASQINHYLFSQMLKNRERELLRKSEFDDIFGPVESEWYETLKAAGLIDYFIPFLPLTEFHVKQCIERDFLKKGRDPSQNLIMAVMEELSFVDMGGKSGQISLTGCKRVHDKVNLHLED